MTLSDRYPSDSRLLEVVHQLASTGGAAELLDREWRLVWVSEDLKTLLGEEDEDALGYGSHILERYQSPPWRTAVTEESAVRAFVDNVPLMAHDTPGGLDALRAMLGEDLAPLIAHVDNPGPAPPFWSYALDFVQSDLPAVKVWCHSYRLHDDTGEFFGILRLYAAGLPAHLLALIARGDEAMVERMARVAQPGRQAAAVLFADLESSGKLSRRLSSQGYFRLIQAITSAIDAAVIEHKGIVGKHVGDGVTAFFRSEDLGSDSSAARAAINTARVLSHVAGTAAGQLHQEGLPIEANDCRLNVGLHWGSGLFMGQIVTGGRLEVTALGDEVNECARIEQTAQGGQLLASKAVTERLSSRDATALDLDPARMAYHALADLPEAGDKARRDAGNIAVTKLNVQP